MEKIKTLSVNLGLLFIVVFSSYKQEITEEGFVAVDGGKIWYKIFGKEKKGTPLLIIHGGPGGRSCSMIPGLSPLASDRPVIFYDQLGSGNSDRPKDTTLWKIERFVNEIEHLRRALNLDKLNIMGHSCGSTFLIEYLITKKPKGIKSVIFSSPMISTPDWIADAKWLLSKLPRSVQDTINKYENLKNYAAPSYIAATDSFYTRHLSRKHWPYKLASCKNVGMENYSIYNYMWGPTEFNSTGTLSNFDRTSDLNNINEPILYVTGEYDEARPKTMFRYKKLSKNAIVQIIDDSGHMTMIDQPEKLVQVINKFLKNVEHN
ncbi:MAG: proline iminopeptidase-family hydrolase [Spirosomataceae bacterium]